MAEEFAEQPGQRSALWMSTLAFTVCFAVWTIFSIIGIQIKAGPRPERNPVRPAGRHPDPDRIADPLCPRHLDRPVRRPPRLHRRDAGGRDRHLAAHLRHDLCAVADRRARRRHRRRLVRGRHRLCVALVSDGEAGNRARHLRRRQCRRRGHQVHRPVRARGLRLAGGRAGLGDRHRRHGASSSGSPPRTIRSCARAARRAKSQRACGSSSSRSRTSRSGASRSIISSFSARSSRCRCGCRAI